jgi:hypothetical protein
MTKTATNNNRYDRINEITKEYFELKERATAHRERVLWSAYRLAVKAGWHGPKPGSGFGGMFHNWVRCGGMYEPFSNPRYDNEIMYKVDALLKKQWEASRIIDKWYNRQMRELPAS